MIIKDYTEISGDELNSFLSDFVPDQKKGYVRSYANGSTFVNDYDKKFIEFSPALLDEFRGIVSKYFPEFDFKCHIIRLNKIGKDTNPNDDFHTDMGTGNVIVLHYPKSNPKFVGGGFQWKNEIGEVITEEVTNGLNLILVDNPPHRVLNVVDGERFSFAIFFDRYKKSGLI